MDEHTLIVIKPDATKRGLTQTILSKLENQGFKVIKSKITKLTEKEARDFYSVHKNKPFFDDLIIFITSGSVFAAVLEGRNTCLKIRELIGSTDPKDAEIGTIRRDFGINLTENSIHASDSNMSFLREYKVLFGNE